MSNPFDMGGMGGMGGLMGMLGGFQQKMEEMKAKAANTVVEGTASGGLVKVALTCDFEVSAVSIDEKAMGDRELLEDLIRAATSDALTKVKAEMANNLKAATGGLPIPPGLLGF
jgi:DNA-binding YbaB/EbfC family protein